MSLLPTIVNWYGGKRKLARQIISIMPEHEHYVEVFMGGAAVYFNKPKASRNTLNDINSNLVNLFIQVRDNYDAFAEKLYLTLYSRDQYKIFYKSYQNDFKNCSDLEKAVMYFFITKASFSAKVVKSLHGDFSSSVKRTPSSINLDLIISMKVLREKLDGVSLENREFHYILDKYDNKETLFYLDPPYYVTIKETRYYEYFFSISQHRQLALILNKTKSPFLLSYDNVPEVINSYKDYFIQRLSTVYARGKTGSKKTTELLITNFRAKKPQLDAFDEVTIEVEEVTDKEKLKSEHEVKLKTEIELENQLKQKIDEPIRDNKPGQKTEQLTFGL